MNKCVLFLGVLCIASLSFGASVWIDGVEQIDATSVGGIVPGRLGLKADTYPLLNALSPDRQSFNVTSDGATITCTVSNAAGGTTLRYYFDNALSTFTVPTNLTLTAGTATAAQINYVSITPSGYAVGTARPTGERSLLAVINVLDAGNTQTNGPCTVQRITESTEQPNERSRISHIGERVRHNGASWDNGMAVTVVTNVNGATEDDLYVNIASGQAWQMHLQSFSAITNVDGSQRYHILNGAAGISVITNLNEIAADANGNAVLATANSYFNIEIVAFQSSGVPAAQPDCVLGILLSTDDYASESGALADSLNQSVVSVDPQFRGVTVRLARLTMRRIAAGGGTWTVTVTDRRGQPLGIAGGGSGSQASSSVFSDTLFRVHDDADPTKLVALQLSGLTTATTRALTVPDKDGTLALLSDITGGAPSMTNVTAMGFRAAMSNNQDNVADATWVTVVADKEIYDTDNGYNVGTYTYTFPSTGLWTFAYTLFWGSINNEKSAAVRVVVVDGGVTNYASWSQVSGAVAASSVMQSGAAAWLVENAGATARLEGFHQSGAATPDIRADGDVTSWSATLSGGK